MTTKQVNIDIGYVPTPPRLVAAILALAKVTADDIVYDLGSGDGRIVIAAAEQFGARGVGIDIDPERIRQSLLTAHSVTELVEFRQQNLFETDFREATVVILYLLPHLNLRLRSQLFDQLRPGTRIVSRDFDMGDWQPDQVVQVSAEEDATLYYWEISSSC